MNDPLLWMALAQFNLTINTIKNLTINTKKIFEYYEYSKIFEYINTINHLTIIK